LEKTDITKSVGLGAAGFGMARDARGAASDLSAELILARLARDAAVE
jgi:hypothetical protein